MPHAHTLYVGLDVHKDSIAVAYGPREPDAKIIDLGPLGTRPCDSDHLVRTRQAKATHLVLVDEAGPCGSWLYRYLTQKGDDCWVVAPSLIPQRLATG